MILDVPEAPGGNRETWGAFWSHSKVSSFCFVPSDFSRGYCLEVFKSVNVSSYFFYANCSVLWHQHPWSLKHWTPMGIMLKCWKIEMIKRWVLKKSVSKSTTTVYYSYRIYNIQFFSTWKKWTLCINTFLFS